MSAAAAAGDTCESTTSTSSSLITIEALEPTDTLPVPLAWYTSSDTRSNSNAGPSKSEPGGVGISNSAEAGEDSGD